MCGSLKSVTLRAYVGGMRRSILILPLVAALSMPGFAQEADEGPSLMEEGARMFLEGILREMEPSLRDLEGMAEDIEPALRDFALQMGPAFADLLGKIDDLSNYHAPEILPNGDIIIRRKVPLVPEDEVEPGEEVEI